MTFKLPETAFTILDNEGPSIPVFTADKVLAAYEQGKAENEWQPIESAPIEPFDPARWFMPHSPYLLLWIGRSTAIGNFGYTQKGKGRWKTWSSNVVPTHWMPLPDAPKSASRAIQAPKEGA